MLDESDIQNDLPLLKIKNVESIYGKVIKMIERLKEEYPLVNKVKLMEANKHIAIQLLQCNKQAMNIIRNNGEIYLLIDSGTSFLCIANREENISLQPFQLKEGLLNAQLRELAQQNVQFDDKVCRQHNLDDDFIQSKSQQQDQYQKDDCQELLSDKFDTFKISDQILIIEILKKYLKKNCIETFNKKLIDIKFYINQNYEIVIEYKIDDNSLSLQQKIKRRKWRLIVNEIKHFYSFRLIEEITQSMLEQLFYIEEIISNYEKEIIFKVVNIAQDYFVYSQNTKLSWGKSYYWMIFVNIPKSFNTHKRFNKYKLILIQNQCDIFLLNHEQFIQTKINPNNILQDYNEVIIQTNIKKLENFKKEFSNLKVDQSLLKDILKFKETVKEIEDLNIFDDQIKTHQEQLNNIQQQIDHIYVSTIESEEYKEQLQMEQEKIKIVIQEFQDMKNEYRRIYNDNLKQICEFKSQGSIEQNKIILKSYYNRIMRERRRIQQNLPIYRKKVKIINQIKENQITLLFGETGSGKSTQLVQYISEEILTKGKVLCAEPRMIAARSLAKRVAEEMDSKVNEQVSYLTEFGCVREKTKIIFTQDRVLLYLLQMDSMLSNYEIIIIDEAHERTMNTDILLGILKQLITIRKDLKIIIMSATMDEILFQKYFQCDVLRVEGKLFPIKIKYMSYFKDEYQELVTDIILNKVIQKINNRTYKQKHVLVFLTGVDEINFYLNKFERNYYHDCIEYFGLHGSMTTEEQFEVFKETNKVKIIFATRVAETALTINDVSVVIDIGIDRFIQFDQQRGMQITTIGKISQAQAKQRAGRAGRTTPGKCYRLYSEEDYENRDQFKIPEIQRCNLDFVVLKLKSFQLDPINFNFIQKPLEEALIRSLDYLINIGALSNDNQITILGDLMSQLQTEPRMSRILIEAFYRDTLDEVLSIISVMLNNTTLFLKTSIIDSRIPFLHESGDFITFYNIYWAFMDQMSNNNIYKVKEWCKANGYHYKTLKACQNTFEEINSSFSSFALKLQENIELKKQILWSRESNRQDRIIRCFLSAFQTDIAVYNGNPFVGYTIISNNKPIRIYGTCTLSVLNHFPKYIICTDLYSSRFDFCRISQEVTLEQMKNVLSEDKLQQFENYIPLNYYHKELNNIPSSLMNHLMHKFQKSYDNNQFTQFFNINADLGVFELWSQNEIDLEKEKEIYFENIKMYRYCKLYGQNMLIYFKNGAEVDRIETDDNKLEVTIIEFSDCPFNIDIIRSMLQQNQYEFSDIFELNVNQFGYCGQIITFHENQARQITYFLNQTCNQYFIDMQLSRYKKYLFRIKPKSLKDRLVKPTAELKFLGCKNKGIGFINFEDDHNRDAFLLAIKPQSLIENRDEINLKKIDNENKEKFKSSILITGLPDDLDVYKFENVLKRKAIDNGISPPVGFNAKSVKLENKVDWIEKIKELFEKEIGESQIYIQLLPDKSDYKITARIAAIKDTLKLEKLAQKLNLEQNILGTSNLYFKTEYKIIKLVLKSVMKQNKNQFDEMVDKLKIKFTEQKESLQIISRINNSERGIQTICIIAKNPNTARYAAQMLHGIIAGYPIHVKLKKYILADLIDRDYTLREALYDKAQKLNFQLNPIQLQSGKIFVYISQNNLQEISDAINKHVEESISSSICVDVKNYSFKLILNASNNIMWQLQQKYNTQMDFQLDRKRVIIYGQGQNALKCKQELIKNLIPKNQIGDDNCGICFDKISEKYILALCNHFYCKSCLQQTIKSSTSPIKCPDQDCHQTICLQDLQQLLNEIDFEKLLDQSFQTYKTKNTDNYVQCITPDCQELFVKISEDQPQFYFCKSCLLDFCNDCKFQAHQYINCEQAKANQSNEKQLSDEVMKQLKIKKCPRCENGIQKSDGCNHLHCKKCQVHFCWLCFHQSEDKDDIYSHIDLSHPGKLFADE